MINYLLKVKLQDMASKGFIKPESYQLAIQYINENELPWDLSSDELVEYVMNKINP